MKKYGAFTAVALLAGSLAFWGCKNGNLFGGFHSKGSGDLADLLSDARSALAQRQFNNAKAYYDAILGKDGNNSEALYGDATATMGNAGLDLGVLLSHILHHSAPAASLQESFKSSAVSIS